MKKDNNKSFIIEIYSKPPKKNYSTDKISCNHFDEILCIDLADFSDYKFPNDNGFTYIFNIFDNFLKYTWAIPLKNKNAQTKTN